MSAGPESLTELLEGVCFGDAGARDRLIEVVYPELRRLAHRYMQRERSDHTLQPTALLNEVFLRLFGTGRVTWQSKAHFFAAAAQAMRRVLIDHARSSRSHKRGGVQARVNLESVTVFVEQNCDELIALDQALKKLRILDPRQEKIVEFRYFGGLSNDEIAEALGISERTVKREWAMARAWLHQQVAGATNHAAGTMGAA